MDFIAIAVLFMLTQLFHFKQTRAWAEERKDLYDRIMSKDLKEYKEAIEPLPKFEPVSNTDSELYWKEIEESKV